MSYEQSGYIPSPQPGAVPPPPEAPMPGAVPPPPGMPYQPQAQPQPGAWGGQPVAGYAPAQMYAPPAPPAPSLFNSPSVLVSKLPMFAMIGLAGFSLAGVLYLVAEILSGSVYHAPMGSYVVNGIGSLVEYVVLGVVWFAVLMGLKHLADQHDAKANPAA